MIKRYLALLSILIFSFSASATHLVGGNLGYEYIGTVIEGGVTKYRYKIILTTYTNCGPDANPAFQVEPEQGPLFVGIYEHDVSGVPLGGTDKNLVDTIGLVRVDTTKITPELPNSCTVGASTCIFEAVYEGFINLDLNFAGYHVFYDRCCRNGSIVNLATPGAEGLAFHAYIGPPLVGNSSPVFTDVPIPFLCVGDTVSILNTAVDPDGDQLVYSFVDPYAGFSSAGAPAPLPPDPTLGWTIPTVGYAGGYSTLQPFGAAGYSFIDGATGLTAYYSPMIGDYVVAVEITEYNASGNIVGITRRDLQLLVLNCPPNPAPNIDPAAGTTANSFTVVEGETLCFDFGFNDPNTDSLELTASGDIFNPAITFPAATIDTPAVGLDTVSATFCWNTACGQAQTLPYQFSVSVTDNGCPPKTTNEVYQITVTPFPAPDTLFGPDVVCEGDTATYTTELIAGATYNWTITGGVTTSISGNQATIQWTTPGTGNVSVTAVSGAGCESDPIDMDVTVVAAPTADAGPDHFICDGDSVQIGGSPTGPIGATYTWSPNTDIDDNTLANPTVFPSITTDYIVIADVGGVCDGRDTVTITVGAATIDAGLDSAICIGDSLQLQATGGVTYSWTPTTGLSDPNIADPIAEPTVTTTYYVNITDGSGCAGTDSVVITVIPLPVINISSDTTICDGDCAQLSASGGGSYNWTPTTGLSDPSIANPLACISSAETYQVVVDNSGCIDSATVTVSVNAAPVASAGNDTTICEADCALLNGSGGVTYSWLPIADLNDPSLEDPTACPTVTTDYELTVTDGNGCTDVDSVTVAVNSLPAVDAGSDINLCTGQDTTLNATGADSYVWTPATDLSDPNIANPVASPSATITYTVTGTDLNGCVNSDDITITLNTIPIVNVSNDTTVCLNDSAQLTASGGVNYSWSPTGGLSDPNVSNPMASPTVNTTYTVVVTNGAGCVDSADVVVSLFALPVVTAGPDTAVCENECVDLLASGATSYAWTPATDLSDPNVANPQACPASSIQYVVEGTDGNGCRNTDTADIVINNLPPVDAGVDEIICNTDSVQLNATGAVSYTWIPTTDLSDPNIANPFASPSATTMYYVTGTDANGCDNIDSMTVNVNGLPIITISNDTTICEGDTAQLIATGGTSYSWTPATDLSDPNIASPDAFPTATITYTAHVIDASGCEDSATVTITVNPLPSISAGADEDLCLNDTVQLNASGGITYVWNPTDSLSDPNIGNPDAWPVDTTQYIVTGTDANGCFNTDTMNVNVLPLPSVDAGMDVWVCPGDNVQLNGSGTGTVAWTPTTGLSDPSVLDPFANPTDTTNYVLTITDAAGCADSDTMTVFVNPDVPSEAGSDTTICEGDTIQIGGNPSSVAGSIYSWVPTAGLDDPTVANPMAFPAVTTTYYLNTTNDTCSGIDSVTIVVNAAPPASAGIDIQICIGDTAQVMASGGIDYSWTPTDSLSDPLIDAPLAWPIDTTDYIVTVTDANNCSASDTMTVIVNPLPAASAGNDTTICLGDTVQLSASGGNSYTWTPTTDLSDPNIFNPLAFPGSTTEFIVSVTDSNSCVQADSMVVTITSPVPVDAGPDTAICLGDSVQLTASGAVGYNWSPSLTLSDPAIADPFAFPTDTTMYFVTGTDGAGCNSIDSVEVVVNPLPNAEAGTNTSICDGDTVQLNASGGSNFNWSPPSTLSNPGVADPNASPLVTTEYFVQVTDSNGCIANDSVTVTVNALPNADAGSDLNICLGDTVGLLATGGTQYQWSPSGFVDNPLVANPNAFPDTTMEFSVQVTDVNSCTAFDTMEIFVFTITVSPEDTTICLGDSVQLNVGGPSATTYIWSPAAGLSNPNIASPMASPPSTTTYTVVVNDVSGCTDSASATVTIEPDPIPSFTTQIDAGCDGVVVEFTNTSTLADSFLWIFSDGSTSTSVNPEHTFTYGTNFTATLVAMNNLGCSDTATFSSSAGNFEDYFNISIPNVFTPNGDGKNDRFEVSVAGKLYSCVDMKVYNRWGQLMFVSTGNNLVWDGRTMAGEKVTQGTYFYTIRVNDYEYNGSVTVFE